MKANEIKTAPFIDILFEHKNKQYGAYELRKNYPKRLRKSILVTSLLVFLLMAIFSSFNYVKPKQPITLNKLNEYVINTVKPDEQPPKKEEIVEKKPIEKGTSMAAAKQKHVYSTPDFTKKPELVSKPNLGTHPNRFGTLNLGNNEDFGTEDGDEQEVRKIDTIKFKPAEITPIEVEKPSFKAGYPGGFNAFALYLQQNLEDEAIEDDTDKKITISFWIETDGSLTNITSENSDDEAFKKKTINVFKKMKKWNPEIEKGVPVRIFKVFPITIILPE